MKLTDDQIKELTAELYIEGREAQCDEVFEALHEAADAAFQEVLTSAGFDPHTIDDEQCEDLRIAYKDGFWEEVRPAREEALRTALTDFLAWANLPDDCSSQARAVRDAAVKALALK